MVNARRQWQQEILATRDSALMNAPHGINRGTSEQKRSSVPGGKPVFHQDRDLPAISGGAAETVRKTCVRRLLVSEGTLIEAVIESIRLH